MPELPRERERVEREFMRHLNRVAAEHRPRIIEALGDPPDPRNIPDELWASVERATREELYWPLALIYLVAYNNLYAEFRQPALPDDAAPSDGSAATVPEIGQDRPARRGIVLPPHDGIEGRDADAWASRRSAELGEGYVDTARRNLARSAWLDPPERRSTAAPPSPQNPPANAGEPAPVRPLPPHPTGEVSPESSDRVRESVGQVFGEQRSRGIAATETTGGISAGEYGLTTRIESQLDWSIRRVWRTERDDSVCPICVPLDGRDEEFYGPRAGAPPAHYNCRCWLTYHVRRQRPSAAA